MLETLNLKKIYIYIFNVIESSSNFGKRQVANGERERERERERDGIEKNQYELIKSR